MHFRILGQYHGRLAMARLLSQSPVPNFTSLGGQGGHYLCVQHLQIFASIWSPLFLLQSFSLFFPNLYLFVGDGWILIFIFFDFALLVYYKFVQTLE